MNKEERYVKLKSIMKDINKKQGETVLDFASTEGDWKKIASGVKEFDDMVGGGFPYGHTSIVWGGAGAGKSTLMYQTVAQAQKEGKIVAFLDLENSFNNERAKTFGVNCADLIIGHYSVAEYALDTIIELAQKCVVDVIILDSIHCYDKETMILTDEGWKFFKDLTGKELVLSLNEDYETTKYTKINKIIKHHHKGKMYKYKGKHCDFCMTSNNGLLFGNPTYKYKFSGWLIGTIKEAIDNWKYNYFLLKKNFVYKGTNPKFIKITGKKRINCKELYTYKIKTDVWCEFLGWWLSEGSSGFKIYKHADKKQCVAVKIHQSIKSPFLVDIEKMLNKLPFTYKKYIHKDEVTYTIHNSLLGRYLIDNCISDKELLYNNKYRGGTKIKKIPTNVKKLSKKHLLIFLESYYKGDGWLSWNGNKCISTSSYQMALDLKEIYLKSGNYVNIITNEIKKQKKWIVDHWATLGGKHYTLTPYTTNIMSHLIIKKNIKEIDYDGYIYDVEVEAKTHLIYLMRNGTSYWASNSMAPKGEVEDKKGKKSLDSNTMALLARKMAQFFRMAGTHVYKSNVALVMIGQTRTDLGGFIALQKLSGGNALIHNSVLTVHMRRGQKSNAPFLHHKEAFLDPDGKFHLQTKKVQDGFECVMKIDKKQCSGGSNEGAVISVPYYYDTGFMIPDENETSIIIDPKATEEEVKIIKEKLVEKGYTQFANGLHSNQTIIDDVMPDDFDPDNNCAKDAVNDMEERIGVEPKKPIKELSVQEDLKLKPKKFQKEVKKLVAKEEKIKEVLKPKKRGRGRPKKLKE